jgi:hypothetical protein
MTKHNQHVQAATHIGQPVSDVPRTTVGKRGGSVRPAKEAVATARRKKKPVGEMILFGTMSLIAYGFIFTNETLITKTFTLGGWHTVFPVLTAFFFSFIHGAFASNLLSVLGLEAKKA